MDAALLAAYPAGLPAGITVTRAPFARDLTWIVSDETNGSATLVRVDPSDHEMRWSPPPLPPRWKMLLNPLGAALDSIDRAHQYERMKDANVVDWDAVAREAREKGIAAIRLLVEARTIEPASRESGSET